MIHRILSLALCLLVSAFALAWKPQFAGHRGGYIGVMNTAEAYRNGCSIFGYQGLECDVRVTADGKYVISHDETTNAVGGSLTVANATLAQLEAETYTQTRGGVTYTGHICTVDTFLKICADSARFPIIELKFTTGINSNDMSNFPGLYALITRYHLEDRAIILTSMLNSLIYVRQNYPNLHCQYLMNTMSDERFNACVQYGLNPSIEAGGVNGCVVKRCHDAGMSVAMWTVNNETNYRLYGNMGVEMMTCDQLHTDQMPELAAVDWDEVCEETVEPFERLYVTELYNFTEAAGTLPSGFPSASQQAQQAVYLDGVFYGNDYAGGVMYAFDTLGNRISTPLPASLRHGFCRDDAGNLILHNSPAAGTPTQLLIYRTPSSAPDTIAFSLPHNGQVNFPTASGDIYSAQGGYVYFYPNGQTNIDILHIANGQLQDVISSATVGITGSTAGVVYPIDNDPTHFIYQVRANGYYLYNSADKGAYVATSATTTAPGRNSSVGGAFFRLGSHNMFLHGSGSNYNGGWTIKDISGDKTSLYTHAPLGTAGYSGNPSCGAFFYVENVDSVTVNIHEWCLGNGYAGWQVTTKKPLVITPVSGVQLREHSLDLPKGGKQLLHAEVLPDSAYVKDVAWTSLAPEIATVDEEGRVSALATGQADIVVTTVEGQFADTCHLTVGEDLAIRLSKLYEDTQLAYLQGKSVRRVLAHADTLFVLALDAAGAPSLYRVNALDPEQYTEISTEVCSVIGTTETTTGAGEYLALSDIALSSDGVLFGCNEEYSTFAPANPLLIYKWEYQNGVLTPAIFSSKASTQTAGNYTKACNGRSMAFLGSSQNGKIITLVHTLGAATRSIRFTCTNIENGVYKSTIYERPTTSPTISALGEDVRLAAYDENHWILTASGTAPCLYTVAGDAGNPAVTTMPAEQTALNGVSMLEVQGVKMMLAPVANGLAFYNAGTDFSAAYALEVSGDTLASSTAAALSAVTCNCSGTSCAYVLRDGKLSRLCITAMQPEEPAPADMYLVGSSAQLGEWNLASALLMPQGEISLTLPKGNYEFKVLPQSDSWDGALNISNVDFTCSSDNIRGTDNIHVSFAAEGELHIVASDGVLCITGDFADRDIVDVYTVVGDQNLLGSNWDLNDQANKMTAAADGTFTLTKHVTLAAGSYKWKVVGDHSWSVQYPQEGDYYLNIAEQGDYEVIFTLDPNADPAGTAVANLCSAVDNISASAAAKKVCIDGHVYIIRDGRTYTLSGILVK